MKKLFTLIFILSLPIYSLPTYSAEKTRNVSLNQQVTTKQTTKQIDSRKLYKEMKLKNKINYTAFAQAIEGYNNIKAQNKNIITLIDFSKPSTDKRLYVIDIKNKKILKSSVVAHGKNSGDTYATSFSNQNGSFKSSLGFYLTETTYEGRNGYSLVLNGLEEGINDQAKQRSIVIHGASYAEPEMITSTGRLGRSLGCPALPATISKEIIDTIKDGSLLYIYANNSSYLKQSTVLKPNSTQKNSTTLPRRTV